MRIEFLKVAVWVGFRGVWF